MSFAGMYYLCNMVENEARCYNEAFKCNTKIMHL